MNHATQEYPAGTCAWCGGTVELWRGKPKKYCSKEHARRYDYYRRKSSAPECMTVGCNKPQIARGLCGTCQSRERRGNEMNHYSKWCSVCGEGYSTPYKESVACSSGCAAVIGGRANATNYIKQCKVCGTSFTGSNVHCSESCANKSATIRGRSSWSPIRKAFELRDSPAMITAIEEKSTKSDSGCWEWSGRISDGYPVQRIGGKTYLVHRLSLEAKMSAPLGSQAAHHMCANSKCVNPEHLQPVTHRENVAEMLARHSYLDRIAELEAALAEVCPQHPILQVIPVM